MTFNRMQLAPYAQRSWQFSVTLLFIDVALYVAMVFGTIAAEGLALKLLFSFAAGTFIALLAIVGHDAGHQSFSTNKLLNRICGTIAFLPALHPFCLWEHHHNRVHHRYAAQLGVDNAFPPMTVEEYRNAASWRRAKYRFIRSLWGQPLFYLLEVWILDMLLPFVQRKVEMTPRVWFDLALVYAYAAAFLLVATLASAAIHDTGLLTAFVSTLVFTFGIPFLIWNAFISFLSIVHHTAPDTRWISPTGRPTTSEEALEGTVHIVFPEWLDRLTHRIMQHQAHHLHVGIPLQHLQSAQAMVAAVTGSKLVRPWSISYHLKLTRECQLYDPHTNRWCRFEDVKVPAATLQQAA